MIPILLKLAATFLLVLAVCINVGLVAAYMGSDTKHWPDPAKLILGLGLIIGFFGAVICGSLAFILWVWH